MSTLLFVCPATRQQVSTGIEIDRSSFKSLPRHTTELRCPRCNTSHVLSGVWAWLGERSSQGLDHGQAGTPLTIASFG